MPNSPAAKQKQAMTLSLEISLVGRAAGFDRVGEQVVSPKCPDAISSHSLDRRTGRYLGDQDVIRAERDARTRSRQIQRDGAIRKVGLNHFIDRWISRDPPARTARLLDAPQRRCI